MILVKVIPEEMDMDMEGEESPIFQMRLKSDGELGKRGLEAVTKKKKILKLMVLPENEGEDKDSDSEGESVVMSLRMMKKVLSQKILPMNLVKIQVENMMVSVEDLLGVKWLKVVL